MAFCVHSNAPSPRDAPRTTRCRCPGAAPLRALRAHHSTHFGSGSSPARGPSASRSLSALPLPVHATRARLRKEATGPPREQSEPGALRRLAADAPMARPLRSAGRAELRRAAPAFLRRVEKSPNVQGWVGAHRSCILRNAIHSNLLEPTHAHSQNSGLRPCGSAGQGISAQHRASSQ